MAPVSVVCPVYIIFDVLCQIEIDTVEVPKYLCYRSGDVSLSDLGQRVGRTPKL